MSNWVRFEFQGSVGFGICTDDRVTVYQGDLFAEHTPTNTEYDVSEIKLLSPCMPKKIVALWNNFYALAEKQGNEIPKAPYYFIKPSSCVIGPLAAIIKPGAYDGRIFYEGELGIVIGKICSQVEEQDALSYVKGYTCVNDVTAMQLIHQEDAFEQWSRAKCFDTFGALGPCITEIDDPEQLTVRTLVNGRERQNYPVSDMIFSPARLVSLISQDMTLEPGDIIACGTSIGALPMKPGAEIEVIIDGIGTLTNQFITADA